MRAVKDGGAKLVAFAPALVLAKRLVRSGADALVIEGSEAGGHIGPVSLTVLAQEILPHDARGAGVRRRRAWPRRGDPRLSGDGRVGRAARHPLRRGDGDRSRIRDFKQAFIRAAARDAVPSVQLDERFPVIPVRGLVNEGTQALPAPTRPRRCDRFQAGELTKEAAQLAIEHFWAGALRRAVIDGDVEDGSVMAGQSVGMVTAEQPMAEIIAGAGRTGRRGARRAAAGA